MERFPGASSLSKGSSAGPLSLPPPPPPPQLPKGFRDRRVGASVGCFVKCVIPTFFLCIGGITLLLVADSETLLRSFLDTEGIRPHSVDVHGIRIVLTSQLRLSERLMPASGGFA
jgi:hypothetical protein